MKTITKEDLVSIAQCGFPKRIKRFIDFEHTEIMYRSGVYRLYYKGIDFNGMFPKESIISVIYNSKEDFQIETYGGAFNHHAAIKKAYKLRIVGSITDPTWKGLIAAYWCVLSGIFTLILLFQWILTF